MEQEKQKLSKVERKLELIRIGTIALMIIELAGGAIGISSGVLLAAGFTGLGMLSSLAITVCIGIGQHVSDERTKDERTKEFIEAFDKDMHELFRGKEIQLNKLKERVEPFNSGFSSFYRYYKSRSLTPLVHINYLTPELGEEIRTLLEDRRKEALRIKEEGGGTIDLNRYITQWRSLNIKIQEHIREISKRIPKEIILSKNILSKQPGREMFLGIRE